MKQIISQINYDYLSTDELLAAWRKNGLKKPERLKIYPALKRKGVLKKNGNRPLLICNGAFFQVSKEIIFLEAAWLAAFFTGTVTTNAWLMVTAMILLAATFAGLIVNRRLAVTPSGLSGGLTLFRLIPITKKNINLTQNSLYLKVSHTKRHLPKTTLFFSSPPLTVKGPHCILNYRLARQLVDGLHFFCSEEGFNFYAEPLTFEDFDPLAANPLPPAHQARAIDEFCRNCRLDTADINVRKGKYDINWLRLTAYFKGVAMDEPLGRSLRNLPSVWMAAQESCLIRMPAPFLYRLAEGGDRVILLTNQRLAILNHDKSLNYSASYGEIKLYNRMDIWLINQTDYETIVELPKQITNYPICGLIEYFQNQLKPEKKVL